MKLYIAVLNKFPDYMTPTLVAHAAIAAHLKFCDDPFYKQWLTTSFKKCVIRVNQKEFDHITALPAVHVIGESKTLNGIPACAVVKPMPNNDLPNVLKFAKLWQPLAATEKTEHKDEQKQIG